MRTWWQNEEVNAAHPPACARACCRRTGIFKKTQKETFYLGLEKTFSWDFEYFSLKRNVQNLEAKNLSSCKNKIFFVWYCQNETRWLHFSFFPNVFGEQNIQLNWVEYAGSLVFAKQFRLPVFLLCNIYSIVKFLIQRPRERCLQHIHIKLLEKKEIFWAVTMVSFPKITFMLQGKLCQLLHLCACNFMCWNKCGL